MFDFLQPATDRRQYKSMSKRNLHIEIPEDGYGEDESLNQQPPEEVD
jgi:hypothetical protein